MTELQVESTKGQRVYYTPALLKVAGVSQYSPEQIRFEGLEDFWTMGEMALNSTGGKVPPIGAIAWFSLATAPMKTKPDKRYHDINKVAKATDEEKAAFQPETYSSTPSGDYASKELPGGSTQGSTPLPAAFDRNGNPMRDPNGQPTAWYWMFNDEQRRLGMAFNNLTTILSSGVPNDIGKFFPNPPVSGEVTYEYITETMLHQWWGWYQEASRGIPLTPVQDGEEPQSVADARELDEQASSHLSEETQELGF